MNIENRPIGEIHPYGKNAKRHPDKQVMQIASSIKEFGWAQPIVVDKTNTIIVGHGRYLAACYLGLKVVPVLTLDIPEEKAKAYRLADNKLNESAWDMQLVVAELKELSLTMLDLTGFERKLVIELADKDDVVPLLPEHARTKLGDVYQLGEHRIICGDSTKEETYVTLMQGRKADMIFTDPPYNVDYKGAGKNTSQGIMNDKMGTAEFASFLTDTFMNWGGAIKRSAGVYVFHSPTTQATFEHALTAAGFEIKYQLIWNKPSAGLGMGDYRNKHEPFFYACMKKADPLFYGDRTNTTIVDFHKSENDLVKWARNQIEAEKAGKHTIWTMKREPTKDYVHPTQKPVELIMYALHNSSKVDDIVLDPFLGSGATLIAAQKTNRVAYGIELDPRFVDVIVQRYCDYTENRTILKNGQSITW